MTRSLFLGAAALSLAAPAIAQHSMPGMTMPMPAPKKAMPKKAVAKKTVVKKPAAKIAARRKSAAAKAPARPVAEPAKVEPPIEPMPAMDMGTDPQATPTDHGAMPGMAAPAGEAPMDHVPMDHAAMDHGAMGHRAMTGALGPYPLSREASGTSWQPDSSEHSGLMIQAGRWTLMAHGVLNLVADHQSGPRGDDKAFASGMLMGMARRPVGKGTLQLKAMVSPDPLMGKRGYPLLLASGETADGVTRLIDRQHPHDLFMELSGSYSIPFGTNGSIFLYAGLPGEPAFGPPAFMHRLSVIDSPEAPISHHWLDSTHITFGVLTAGLVAGRVKVEASRFNGREPDQHRYNIETGQLDSTSLRLSWNPSSRLSLQGSWAHLEEPEQLEAGVDQKRLSASAIYTVPMARGWWSSTLAWGRKTAHGERLNAYALESAIRFDDWTLFGRAERTQNDELGSDGAASVGKASLGLVRDVRIAPHLSAGIGGLYSLNFVPRSLEAAYGGDPHGAMGFVRVKLD